MGACATGDASGSDPLSGSPNESVTSSPTRLDAGTAHDASKGTHPPDAAAGDTGSPPPKPDAATPCTTTPPSNKCGLAPQCGCAANETCDVVDDTTGAVACVAAGAGALGTACTTAGAGSCAVGLTCVEAACRPYCAFAGGACSGPGVSTCYDATPTRKVCGIACDPHAPSAACGTNACDYVVATKVVDCRAPGAKKAWDRNCTAPAGCKPGLSCITWAGDPTIIECEPWCRLPDAQFNDCGNVKYTTGASTRCVDRYTQLGQTPPVVGGVTYGVCQD